MNKENNTKISTTENIKRNVACYISRIEYGLKSGKPETTAKLAQLRKGIGKNPGEITNTYSIIFREMPEELMGSSGAPTKKENAVYTAITLYAFAQQGWQTSMNTIDDSVDIGKALAMLAGSEKDANAVSRANMHLTSICKEYNIRGLSSRLRGIISLLKSKGIPVNYSVLARDLYLFQIDSYRSSVVMRWVQSFSAELSRNR